MSKKQPSLEISTSRNFASWLDEADVSLAFTTYQAGKLFLCGTGPEGRVAVFERTFHRCMGLWAADDGQSFWMSSIYQLWRFQNMLGEGELSEKGHDRLYTPQVGYTTGDLDVHDMVVDDAGRLVFVNTLFTCLATTDDTYNFVPLWQPPFVSKLAAEDRCHLNGLALRDGQPRYVTAVSESDVADGWRDHRNEGGIVMDVRSNEVVARGLSMPHSPRWYRDRLWLLDSGTGYFGFVDLDSGEFERVAFCPGYLRGLCFAGNYAIAGLSLPRHNRSFQGLALQDHLEEKNAEPRCGICVIDLNTGDVVHHLRVEGVVVELYDVVALPHAKRPMMLGFRNEEIHRLLSIGPNGKL